MRKDDNKLNKLLHQIKNKAKKAYNELKFFKPANYGRARYFWFREHEKLQEKMILLESVQGAYPQDNIAAILWELAKNPVYGEYTLWLSGGADLTEQRKQYLSLLELLIGTIIWKSIYLYLQFFYPVYSKHTNMKLKDL